MLCKLFSQAKHNLPNFLSKLTFNPYLGLLYTMDSPLGRSADNTDSVKESASDIIKNPQEIIENEDKTVSDDNCICSSNGAPHSDFKGFQTDCKISLKDSKNSPHEIIEGQAKIITSGKVFYNPVQEFNRDLSLTVLSVFAKNLKKEQVENKKRKQKINSKIKSKDNDEKIILNNSDIQIIIDNIPEKMYEAGTQYKDGISILEALSATGLRSIRYAKEIQGVKEIIANDLSQKAVEDIEKNIRLNNVENLVRSSNADAILYMVQHKNQFDAVDLDPYGSPTIFLDSAVQSVKEGGLLLVTATDMAVLAGNSPETCYVKYGAVSLRLKSCHEMAVRILLQCIESHANRHGRYIVPLLSISADFYIRVFVRVFYGPQTCKHTTSKLSQVYHCTGCDGFVLQPLGITKPNEKIKNLVKFCLPIVPAVPRKCEECGGSYHMGGPIWSAPIHDPKFVQQILDSVSPTLGTFKRIFGVMNVILEELINVPLYYTLDRLAATIHVDTPPMLNIRSAILNAGYKVSYTHMNKKAIKTDAPAKVIWDIMRCWEKEHPVSQKRKDQNKVLSHILSIKPEKEYSFKGHPEANPESKKRGFVRFQANPLPFWGPGSRDTAMVGKEKMVKSKRNQNKRKREPSEEPKEL